MKINVEDLTMGVKLGRDIYNSNAQILLPRGTLVTSEHINSLLKRGIKEVYVSDDLFAKNEVEFSGVYNKSLDAVNTFMTESKFGKPLESTEINEVVDCLFDQVFNQTDLFRQMRLMNNKDEYLMTHSVNVAMLAMLIGRWLNYSEETIKDLGMSGILHDIGKIFIDDDILNKPGRLTPEEYLQMKEHVSLGYNFLLQSNVGENIAGAVLNHHERMDGSGYPKGTQGYNNSLAAIISVCDVYDAITSNRVYQPKSSPYTAADIIWDESFGRLDPVISRLFYNRITSLSIGTEVILSNGENGTVIYLNPYQPTRPTIMVGESFYDLTVERSLCIMEVIDKYANKIGV